MRRILHIIGAVIFVALLTPSQTNAQDLHYTQFYNSPMNINPALTGIFNGDKRFIGSFRDQWRSVPVPWQTFSAAFDSRITPAKRDAKGFFSYGLNFNYDKQGISRLNLINLNLLGSYTFQLNDKNLITGGLTFGYVTRGFDDEDLTWDSQWDGKEANLTTPSGEPIVDERIGFLETGLGLNYRWQKDHRTNFNLGVGGYHIAQPKTSFYGLNNVKIPPRISIYGVGNIKLTKTLDFQLHALQQLQEAYDEFLIGGLAKLYLNQSKGKEFQLHLGATYRTTESLAPTIAVQYNSLYVGFSYDMDLSFFEVATEKRAGPEIHVTYIITKVPTLQEKKKCPIY